MDDDGFAVHSRRRRGTIRGSAPHRDGESGLSRTPRYAGTDKYFEKAHAQRYGREEGLGPHGKHHHGSARFPRGSEREEMHAQYNRSTRPRDMSRTEYENELRAAELELERMGIQEQQYYEKHTGGLTPHQHERLDPRASSYRDNSFRNAKNREAFLGKHPYGYHTAQEQRKHHDYASNAYDEFEYAKDRQKYHEKHRSFSNVDPRRDRWGRPVSHR